MTAFVRSFVRSFVRFNLLNFVRSISSVRYLSFDFVRSVSFVRFRSFDFVRSISIVRFRSSYGQHCAIAARPHFSRRVLYRWLYSLLETRNVTSDITFISARRQSRLTRVRQSTRRLLKKKKKKKKKEGEEGRRVCSTSYICL